jgi:hypothetical protein
MSCKKESRSRMTAKHLKIKMPWWAAAACLLVLAGALARAGEDPGAKAVQQQQLQRQQQEDALQLRMRQQQRETRAAPADAKQKQALEQQHAGQRARQQALHDRQVVEPAAATPGDDAGARAAKAELERRKAQEESRRQLQRLETERPAR